MKGGAQRESLWSLDEIQSFGVSSVIVPTQDIEHDNRVIH